MVLRGMPDRPLGEGEAGSDLADRRGQIDQFGEGRRKLDMTHVFLPGAREASSMRRASV